MVFYYSHFHTKLTAKNAIIVSKYSDKKNCEAKIQIEFYSCNTGKLKIKIIILELLRNTLRIQSNFDQQIQQAKKCFPETIINLNKKAISRMNKRD